MSSDIKELAGIFFTISLMVFVLFLACFVFVSLITVVFDGNVAGAITSHGVAILVGFVIALAVGLLF